MASVNGDGLTTTTRQGDTKVKVTGAQIQETVVGTANDLTAGETVRELVHRYHADITPGNRLLQSEQESGQPYGAILQAVRLGTVLQVARDVPPVLW